VNRGTSRPGGSCDCAQDDALLRNDTLLRNDALVRNDTLLRNDALLRSDAHMVILRAVAGSTPTAAGRTPA
jgi:hypothetical protein